MYNVGKGTSKNYQKAFEWTKKSAEQGYASAQFALGAMYYDGIAIDGDSELPINNQKAYTYFLICDYLEYKQDTVKELINELEQKLSPQAITDAQNEADKMIQGFK